MEGRSYRNLELDGFVWYISGSEWSWACEGARESGAKLYEADRL